MIEMDEKLCYNKSNGGNMYEKDNIVARCFIKLKHGFFSTGVY